MRLRAHFYRVVPARLVDPSQCRCYRHCRCAGTNVNLFPTANGPKKGGHVQYGGVGEFRSKRGLASSCEAEAERRVSSSRALLTVLTDGVAAMTDSSRGSVSIPYHSV